MTLAGTLAACFPLVRMGGTISMPGMYVEDAASMPYPVTMQILQRGQEPAEAERESA